MVVAPCAQKAITTTTKTVKKRTRDKENLNVVDEDDEEGKRKRDVNCRKRTVVEELHTHLKTHKKKPKTFLCQIFMNSFVARFGLGCGLLIGRSGGFKVK